MKIESVVIYAPKNNLGYHIGAEVPEGEQKGVKVIKIQVLWFNRVKIKFSDGYEIIYKGLPYSIEREKGTT